MGIPTYIIITTFPESGSKNIGDKLIEYSTKKIIEEIVGECNFITYWRKENLQEHLEIINNSQGVIFACLAVRRKMFPDTYTLVENIDKITVPMIILSAGTSVASDNLEADPFAYHINVRENDKKKLLQIASRYKGVSCRGEITYNYLKNIGIENISMTGDIAFYDNRFNNLDFQKNKVVNAIAVSTPHYPAIYANHFYYLLSKIRSNYPTSKITVFVHGKSEWIEQDKLQMMDCDIKNIYLDDISALDEYIEYDFHIGYRVHAHVSALKRRIPSYLLAVDGRGYDYGLTVHTGTTFKAWKVTAKLHKIVVYKIFNLIKRAFGDLNTRNKLPVEANDDVVDYVVDLIKRDQKEEFSRFIGFEKEILKTVARIKDFLRDI